jgi:hypothetical protein
MKKDNCYETVRARRLGVIADILSKHRKSLYRPLTDFANGRQRERADPDAIARALRRKSTRYLILAFGLFALSAVVRAVLGQWLWHYAIDAKLLSAGLVAASIGMLEKRRQALKEAGMWSLLGREQVLKLLNLTEGCADAKAYTANILNLCGWLRVGDYVIASKIANHSGGPAVLVGPVGDDSFMTLLELGDTDDLDT